MFIFLDESGDLGFNFKNKKPSNTFIITLLVCNGIDTTRSINRAVKKTLKNKINHQLKYKINCNELKGSSTTSATKKYFYNSIESNDWSLYSLILKKHNFLFKNKYPLNGKEQEILYNSMATKLIEKIHLNNEIFDVTIRVDRRKAKKYIQPFNESIFCYLGTKLSLKTKISIEHELSFHNPNIQAVDLFCWGFFRKYELNDLEWYNMFKDKIIYEGIYI